MKIGIDARMIHYSGIGTYIRGIISSFPQEARKNIILFGSMLDLAGYGYPVQTLTIPVYSLREHIYLSQLYRKCNLDVLHVPHYNVPYWYRGKYVVTVHDIIHLLFPQFLPHRFAYLYAYMIIKNALKQSLMIITDSENSKHDIQSKFNIPDHKMKVIYSGVDTGFFNVVSAEKIDRIKYHYSLPARYILFVGNIRPIKNIPRLVEAFRLFQKRNGRDYSLVLAGKNFFPQQYWKMNSEKEGIIIREGVPSEDLPAIYQGASVFAFPSLYEGFGLPPLEAMASGIPVVCSNAGSLPEITGDAAILVHPHDVSGISNALETILGNDALRSELVHKGKIQASKYTWRDAALKHWIIYQELLT